jgi:antitoxin component HigA of HigAB toxin-antitoxin module
MNTTEWGRIIGFDRSTASRLLRGQRKSSTTHVRKTAEALGLEASLLIYRPP